MLAQRLHFNTFGGNPVCSAGGRAVLRAIDEDGVQANSAKVPHRVVLRQELLLQQTLLTVRGAAGRGRGRRPGQLRQGGSWAAAEQEAVITEITADSAVCAAAMREAAMLCVSHASDHVVQTRCEPSILRL